MTVTASPIMDSILARRSASAKNIVAPGPSGEALERILFAASRAPDHGRLVPFRFVLIADEARDAFGDVLAEASRQERPDLAEPEVERAREKAYQGPCLVALIGRIEADHPKIPASDQWLSVGCALENLVLAAQSEGFAAAIRSGRSMEMPACRDAFALQKDEHFTCFVVLGTATEWPPAKPKPALTTLVTTWKGNPA